MRQRTIERLRALIDLLEVKFPRKYYVYRGWTIAEGPSHPATGRWRAAKHGVTIGAHSKAAVHRMIDRKEEPRCEHCGRLFTDPPSEACLALARAERAKR